MKRNAYCNLDYDSSISNISKYINRLLNKDYSLDIIDNDEVIDESIENKNSPR